MEKEISLKGRKAPDLCLKDENGKEVCLRDLKGTWTVLYFYPKDDTSGCTLEAKDFTCSVDEFAKMGAKVVGVSPDPVKSHLLFIGKHGLRLTLLSDPEHGTIEAYGAWKEKSMYGRKHMGVERSTFLIDKDGIVRKEWRNVKVEGHVDEVKAAIKELSSL